MSKTKHPKDRGERLRINEKKQSRSHKVRKDFIATEREKESSNELLEQQPSGCSNQDLRS